MQLLQSVWQRKEQKFYLLIPGLQEQGWFYKQQTGYKGLMFGHNIIYISVCYQAACVIVLVECDNRCIIVREESQTIGTNHGSEEFLNLCSTDAYWNNSSDNSKLITV